MAQVITTVDDLHKADGKDVPAAVIGRRLAYGDVEVTLDLTTENDDDAVPGCSTRTSARAAGAGKAGATRGQPGHVPPQPTARSTPRSGSGRTGTG